ncbi:MAG TPA: hypothetical protein VJZ76_08315 [Thermoanaerobaculia bacterium]|nr:hypothetical protein [Thermoanaerobaculia bacterium]
MRSSDTDSLELPDFERDMPLDDAALDALDRARQLPAMTFQEYLDFLSSIWIPGRNDQLPPFSEPFTL